MLVALIQSQIFDFEIDKNLNNLTDISNHLSDSVDWVLFPEMFLTGFVAEPSLCDESKQKGLNFMCRLAAEKQCAVEGSLLVGDRMGKTGGEKSLQTSDTAYYNRHFFVTEKHIEYYDKRKLFSLSQESNVLTHGTGDSVVTFDGWKINMKTCYDLRFPDICKNAYGNVIDGSDKTNDTNDDINGSNSLTEDYTERFKYDIMTFVASWPTSRRSQWLTLLQARAIENQSYVIGVNRCGTDASGVEYSGDSCVVNMKGEFVQEIPQSEIFDCIRDENIHYYNLSKESLISGRKKFPVYLDW